MPADYLYTGNSPSASFTMNPFLVDPPGYCTILYSCQTIAGPVAPALDLCAINDGLSRGTFDAATGNFVFESFDNKEVVLPGTYTFQITATVGSTVETVDFDLVLVNPCIADVTLTEIASPFVDEVKDLGDPETLQTWDLTNMVSSDAVVDCGPIVIEFYLNDATQTLLDPLIFADRRAITTNEFASLLTVDYAHVGVYDIGYTFSLEDYPPVSLKTANPF